MRTIQIECIVFRKKEDKYEFILLKRIPKKRRFLATCLWWNGKSANLQMFSSYILNKS